MLNEALFILHHADNLWALVFLFSGLNLKGRKHDVMGLACGNWLVQRRYGLGSLAAETR